MKASLFITCLVDQFFPEVVATGPGSIAVTWTDRREDATLPGPVGNRMMAQWATFAKDGGRKLSGNRRASDVLFAPTFSNPNTDPLIATCYAGDYNALYFDGKDVLAAWGDNRDSLLVEGVGPTVIPDPNVYFRRIRVP